MAQQKTKHASHTASCQLARTQQSLRRKRRLTSYVNGLRNKMRKMEAQGRSTAGILRAIENAEYAISYERTEGKKGRAGVPDPLEIPHESKPFKGKNPRNTHVRVWYRTANNMGVSHGDWVTKADFNTYVNTSV